jgi:hypothetical protein
MTAGSVRLGAGPRDETPPTDLTEALRACRAYRQAFRLLLGDEPAGARLVVLPSLAEESPFELVCEFDPTDEDAAGYAAACGLAEIDTWASAGLAAPPGRGALLCETVDPLGKDSAVARLTTANTYSRSLLSRVPTVGR